MRCPHCKQDVPDTNYKCPHCGKVISAAVNYLHESGPTRRSAPSPINLLIAAIVLVLVVGGYLIFKPGDQQPVNETEAVSSGRQAAKRQPQESPSTGPGELSSDDAEESEPVVEAIDPFGYDPDNEAEGYEIEEAVPYEQPQLSHTPGEEVDISRLAYRGMITVFDFYSEYCGPCRVISPKLEELDSKRDDLVVVKIDINRPHIRGIDWYSPVARQYKLSSIPHFVIFDEQGRRGKEGSEAYQQIYLWLQEANIQ